MESMNREVAPEGLLLDRPMIDRSWLDVGEKLQFAGLRPTRQRMALGRLLFESGDRHITAEMLYDEAIQSGIFVSLATVYNTINRLIEVGLLRQITIDGNKNYFDTKVSAHHHYYLETEDKLIDILDPHFSLVRTPEVPDGYEISRVEMVVRLRKKPRV